MKKLPKGISNYEKLIDNNYYYVDKTMYIEKLENLSDNHILFLRPRKFGKTLFTSVLESYYDLNKKDKFDLLFKDTYIYNNLTINKNNYYILRFDFSGIDTSSYENTIKNFKEKVIVGIQRFINQYNFTYEINENDEAEIILVKLFNYFEGLKLENKIYVIIDEYDHFANELLSFDLNNFKNLVSKNGKVRKFYEILKTGTFTVVDRIFLTGVAPITMDSLTSGFNIAKDISRDSDFNTMCGFTEEEINRLIDVIELNEDEKHYLKPIMKEYYDGYKFALETQECIYNSNMCLYLLEHFSRHKRLPNSLIDPNIASDYSKLAGMLNLSLDEQRKNIIEKSILNEPILCDIVDSFSPEKGFELRDLISMLYYLGYLTIKGEEVGTAVLGIPNEVMRGLYSDYFMSLVSKELGGTSIDFPILKSDLALNGNINKITEVLEKLLSKLSNRDYQNFDEKYVKILFYSIVQNFDNIYKVKSEYEVERKYPDLLLIPNNPNENYYTVLIEFKYLKKTDENKLEETMNKAINQVMEYSNMGELKGIETIRKYVVVVVNSKVYLKEV